MALLLLVFLAMQAPSAGAGAWQHTFDDPIIAISAEHDGNCFAALTARELAVFTYEGRRPARRGLTRLIGINGRGLLAVRLRGPAGGR